MNFEHIKLLEYGVSSGLFLGAFLTSLSFQSMAPLKTPILKIEVANTFIIAFAIALNVHASWDFLLHMWRYFTHA